MDIIKAVQLVGDTERGTRNIERRLAKATEELGELAEAVIDVTSHHHSKGKSPEDIMEEAVDLAIVAVDIALTRIGVANDVDDNEMREMVELMFGRKLNKWQKQVTEGRSTG